MDPNETLARLREALSDAERAMDPNEGSNDAEHDVLRDMAGLIESLDNWLSRGGFLPDAWQSRSRYPEMVTKSDAQAATRAIELRAHLDSIPDPFDSPNRPGTKPGFWDEQRTTRPGTKPGFW